MGVAHIRCYAELNDFLPPSRRQAAFVYAFSVPGSVKDALESLGVPHPEIGLILVNGEPAGFDRLLASGDRVAAYPRFRTLDVSGISPVHLAPLAEPRFLLDGHLGRLARYLRLLGCDAAHRPQAEDAELAARATAEDRILLTRDLDLLKRSVVRRGYRVRATDPFAQAVEVLRYFDLVESVAPFTRCLPCGERLGPLPATAAAPRVPPAVAARHTDFRHCPGCGRVYWAGTHHSRLAALVERLRLAASSPG
ncbi:MAG: Mut7-C ubiquitin/RNAse domain-containing protein [Acidimicrobiia bacterium]|nr:Mut7-C ubiquitin/RNAse domain-containing protein [Acidimicrobiia bacterium]